jgi:dienelactone hydrolase
MTTDRPTPGEAAPDTLAPTRPAPRRRRWPRVLALVLLLGALLVVVGGALFLAPQPLLPEATAALASTDAVTYADEGDWLAFTPTGSSVDGGTTGFIFYPGAKVPAAAYAPAAQVIAAAGHPTFIAEMPLNLAILDGNAAADIQAAHPDVTRWVLGGHSLGGVMAAGYAGDHPDSVDGLALWAAYPSGDISGAELISSSIYGTLDAGADRMTSAETKATLPTSTTFVAIEGGNHEQMGWYTGQPNDPPATISREEQQARVVAATLDVLKATSR